VHCFETHELLNMRLLRACVENDWVSNNLLFWGSERWRWYNSSTRGVPTCYYGNLVDPTISIVAMVIWSIQPSVSLLWWSGRSNHQYRCYGNLVDPTISIVAMVI